MFGPVITPARPPVGSTVALGAAAVFVGVTGVGVDVGASVGVRVGVCVFNGRTGVTDGSSVGVSPLGVGGRRAHAEW